MNGPSLLRIVRTTLQGWQRYRQHPDARIRRRYTSEVRDLTSRYAPVLWAMKHYYRHQPQLRAKVDAVLRSLSREFGVGARLAAKLGGPYVLWKLWREQRRLANGWTYEPPTFYELNEAAVASNLATQSL